MSITATKKRTLGGGHIAEWLLLLGETGNSISTVGAPDSTVHIFGTFGGATVTFEGSNDPLKAAWATLHDITGADLVATTTLIAMISENSWYIRPVVSGGDGTTSLNINVVSKRSGR